MTDALNEIEKLALDTAKKAQEVDTSLQSKIDALKSLAPYYSILAKARGKEPEDDEGSLETVAASIAQAERENDGGSPKASNGLHARTRSRN